MSRRIQWEARSEHQTGWQRVSVRPSDYAELEAAWTTLWPIAGFLRMAGIDVWAWMQRSPRDLLGFAWAELVDRVAS